MFDVLSQFAVSCVVVSGLVLQTGGEAAYSPPGGHHCARGGSIRGAASATRRLCPVRERGREMQLRRSAMQFVSQDDVVI